MDVTSLVVQTLVEQLHETAVADGALAAFTSATGDRRPATGDRRLALTRIEHERSLGALYAAFPLEQCVVLIADWQCLLRTLREPFHDAASERKVSAHEVGQALAGWDGLLIERDDTYEDSRLTAVLQSPLAARIGLVSRSACPGVRWTQELWRVTAVACHLPCPRHRHADELIRSLPVLPAEWRPAVLAALRAPGEWTVKRVCYEARTRRRTLERWCQKMELPSPAALFGGEDVTHFCRTSRVASR